MKVAEILNDDGEWDERHLWEMFDAQEAEGILRTPVGEKGLVDVRWWEYEPKGAFTAKTTYLATLGYYEQREETSGIDSKFWTRMVWGSAIPPKVKVFMWKALNNFIPTEGNLKSHHVPIEGMCQLCFDR